MTQLSRELVERLRAAYVAAPADDAELRSAVCASVDELTNAGLPIERIVIYIKRAADGGITPAFGAGRGRGWSGAEQAVIDRAVTWCIERYFDRPSTNASRSMTVQQVP